MIFEKFEEWKEQSKIESDALARKKQELIDLMIQMPIQTLEIAYLYAKIYTEYGADVTKTWLTTIENASSLEKAYRKGYYDRRKDEYELRKSEDEELWPMSTEEAAEELKSLEFYCRPFDNSTEETNKANRKREALYMAIQLLENESERNK